MPTEFGDTTRVAESAGADPISPESWATPFTLTCRISLGSDKGAVSGEHRAVLRVRRTSIVTG